MIYIYDPVPSRNEYATFFLNSIVAYGAKIGADIRRTTNLDDPRGSAVLLLTDYLNDELILKLKENGNNIIGFNVTDSSYISGAIRYSKVLHLMDIIYMVSGIPITNYDSEFGVDKDFNVVLTNRPFLDESNWEIFNRLRVSGILKSLPYVPWTPIPDVPRKPYNLRSQKVIMRGGGHSRRFILALFLLKHGMLDTNSGFVLTPYFADNMNPQFRYCDTCRAEFKRTKVANYIPNRNADDCLSPARSIGGVGPDWELDDLGQWNNRCPRSFYWMAEQFQKNYGAVDMGEVQKMLNASWLHPNDYLAMLGRITFTSDLKWIHSIYAPQRFWEAASAGCINVLPSRTTNQEFFPMMSEGEHYFAYGEEMDLLDHDFQTVNEPLYEHISGSALHLYNQWIKPTEFPMNTNLLSKIFKDIEES